jgi:heterodisulfide reductase subunit C
MSKEVDIYINDILRSAGVYSCVECGKCVAVCPMYEMYPDFSIKMSPRGIIKKALLTGDILSDENIWYCTECNACTDICPEGVSCRDLIRGLRKITLEKGLVRNMSTCRDCGVAFVPAPVMGYIHHGLNDKPLNFLDICPSCRRKAYLLRNA